MMIPLQPLLSSLFFSGYSEPVVMASIYLVAVVLVTVAVNQFHVAAKRRKKREDTIAATHAVTHAAEEVLEDSEVIRWIPALLY
jgi:hypothetical protein